jgi:hypothetical protein
MCVFKRGTTDAMITLKLYQPPRVREAFRYYLFTTLYSLFANY